ncbi:hypothetical protein [Candidatus Nanohalococcus occultus]|uniref:hypothetical protein n=1 Tax=Candidatus Nanohalococcus occultus TaxID=2978047 RepID=UPI0039DF8DB1
MERLEDISDYLEGKETTRRKLLAGAGALGLTALAGCSAPDPDYTDWGRFRIKAPGGLPFQLEEDLPFVTYSAPLLEETAQAIHDQAEQELSGPTVRETQNKVLMDTFYFSDDEILSAMERNPRLVGDEDEISRLIGNNHYATMRMGIKASGETRDIRQYLAKDLRAEYINNISQPFKNSFEIAYDLGEPVFDIGGADERDDQFIGMELYVLGNGGSKAGRYFNTSEIKKYAEGKLSALESDLEEEAVREGGFEFYL